MILHHASDLDFEVDWLAGGRTAFAPKTNGQDCANAGFRTDLCHERVPKSPDDRVTDAALPA